MDKKVWYVSGASKGLGLALIHKLLTKGYRVAATSRLLPALVEAAGGNITGDFLPLEVDAADERSVADSFRATLTAFGRIDVVVNNAGLGFGNFATPTTVISQALPFLRSQGHGHVIDIAGKTDPNDRHFPGIHSTIVMRNTPSCVDEARTEGIKRDALHVSIDGRQLSDPLKAATALIQIATMPRPPALLILGSDAYSRARAKITEFGQQLDRQLVTR